MDYTPPDRRSPNSSELINEQGCNQSLHLGGEPQYQLPMSDHIHVGSLVVMTVLSSRDVHQTSYLLIIELD